MSELLTEYVGDCIIVNPSRYGREHRYHAQRLNGTGNAFQRQTDWERHFLKLAAEKWSTGCIIFWLQAEHKGNPRKDGQPYARDTYGEIGEWRGRMMYPKDLRVAMGAEPEFPGLSQIARNFELALGSGFEIRRTMEEVVERAAYLAKPSLSFAARTSA